MTRSERAAFTALLLIAAVTAAWWALALWPLPDEAPYWLVRTREVCFGSLPDTLPSRAGWILLVGEPLTMTVALAVLWPAPLAGAFGALARSARGRAALALGALLLFVGAGAASARIASASSRTGIAAPYLPPPPPGYPRLDRPAPALDLVDQHGDTVSLASLAGRPALVTFAYAHCMTVCPVAVREALDAQRHLASRGIRLLVITTDPWRDTPERLPAIAAQWQLGANAQALSGDTSAVLAALDAWNIPHARDHATGEVTHAAIVYLVDADGRIAYAAAPRADAIVTLARRMP